MKAKKHREATPAKKIKLSPKKVPTAGDIFSGAGDAKDLKMSIKGEVTLAEELALDLRNEPGQPPEVRASINNTPQVVTSCVLYIFLLSQPEVLVKCLQELENAASSDAVVREKIASLPAEVSDVAKLENLRGIYNIFKKILLLCGSD